MYSNYEDVPNEHLQRNSNNIDINNVKQLFSDLKEGLREKIMNQGTIKEIKEGETLLGVGKTIRSTFRNALDS